MIIHVRKWLERLRFLLLFAVLTLVAFIIMQVVTEWMDPVSKYKEPEGHAVKVFGSQDPIRESGSLPERLRLFYWYGE